MLYNKTIDRKDGVGVGTITVWTKQHENVAKILEEEGRFVAKKEFVVRDMDDHNQLVLQCYNWLTANTPAQEQRPADADYPIWLSVREDATMKLTPHTVVLELELDESLMTRINIEKWSAMLNYSYIAKDKADAEAHRQLLEMYGTNDAKAFMTPFYPQIKMEIMNSWHRLFDDSVTISGNGNYYGNIWEVKKEWIRKIIR